MKKRSQWSSSFGFIMATVGASVGLGNIWGFPYKLGQGGGFVFLFCYLLFVVLAGYPVLIGEFALGRSAGLGAVGAYKKVNRKFGFVGLLGVLACFIILAVYSYFGGMIFSYIIQYIKEFVSRGATADYYSYFTSSVISSVVWLFLFIAATAYIVIKGVSEGIEKVSKVMMPLLLLMLVFIAGQALSMPGSGEALRFMFAPDFSKFNLKTLTSALCQVFFSLSLGQGIMITYSSYLNKKENLERSAILVPLFDTLVAVLAAVAIIPGVFSLKLAPEAGPSLMFDTLPRVFAAMKGGTVIGLMFFILLFFATITSSVSMLEVPVAALMEQFKIKRKTSAAVLSLAAFLAGIPVCFNIDLFEVYEFFGQYILITLSSLLMCLVIVRYWKTESAIQEITQGSRFVTGSLWRFLIKYVTPILIAFVFLVSVGIIKI